jgi:hypothetical protein
VKIGFTITCGYEGYKKMTKKEKEFCEFMLESIIDTKNVYYRIIHTPDDLLEDIEKNNREECDIFHKYSYEPNYWDSLKEEYEKSILLNE